MADNTRLAREVGAKIKYLRQKRGLSQEALALSCDIEPSLSWPCRTRDAQPHTKHLTAHL